MLKSKKRKLDVLIISAAYEPDGGGVASHVQCLAESLNKLTKSKVSGKKCHVHVLTTGEHQHKEGEAPFLQIHRVPGKNRHFDSHSAGDVPLSEPVRYGLDNWQKLTPDIIHAHDFESVQVALMFKAAFKIPLIITVHKAPKEWDRTLPQRDVKDCFLQAILDFKIADRLIAASTAYRDRLLEQGFSSEQIVFIPHGVSIKKLSGASEPNVLKRFALDDTHELILCPSRLDAHKGLETFIEAAKIIKQNSPDRNLVFAIAGAGNNDYRSKLKRLAQDNGVDEFLRLGASDGNDCSASEMATLFRRAKVCVVPSRREGFGLVVLEAFVFRTPVVASNTGGIRDLISPGENGCFFHRDEPSDLAHQVTWLLQNPKIAEKFKLNAYEIVKTRYDSETMARAYFELYKEVAGVEI
jgi:glycosyltransferase involved in cell wall biosynthesis